MYLNAQNLEFCRPIHRSTAITPQVSFLCTGVLSKVNAPYVNNQKESNHISFLNEKKIELGLRNSLILSLKLGIHSASKESYLLGFSDGFLISGSAEFPVAANWHIGANFETWTSSTENFKFQPDIISERSSRAFQIFLSISYRGNPNPLAFKFVSAIGNYNIRTSSTNSTISSNYFSFECAVGLLLKLNDIFLLESDLGYKRLTSFDSSNDIIYIKVGPSLLL